MEERRIETVALDNQLTLNIYEASHEIFSAGWVVKYTG